MESTKLQVPERKEFAMSIEEYSFGRMVYNGQTYTADLIIFPDRVIDSWWRKQGHLLQIEDLDEILKQPPGILVIGCGKMGVMRVPKKLKTELENRGIQLHVERTKKAVNVFNDLSNDPEKKQNVIGAFHLTC